MRQTQPDGGTPVTWIAISPSEDQGMAPVAFSAALGEDLIERGSLFLEADLDRDRTGERPLFQMRRSADVTSQISVRMTEDGGVVFARRLGRRNLQVSLTHEAARASGPVRISVSWDAPAKSGLLSLERLDDGTLVQKEFSDPLPWLMTDVERVQSGSRDVVLGAELRSYGVSDCPEPVGIIPSMCAGTPILTTQGYRRIDSLAPGDLVTTETGDMPVLWTGAREVPARGRLHPLQLCAPYFGLRHDVVIAPEQRLLITGGEVEYLFGEEAVLVEANRLLNTPFVMRAPSGPTVRYYQILLAEHAILDVAGAPMDSLFAGRLRETPQVLANTILGGVGLDRMPLHPCLAYPALREYEAVTLRAALLSR